VVVLPSRTPATATASLVTSSPGHAAQRWIDPNVRRAPVRDDGVTALAPRRRGVGARNATPIADSHDGLGNEQKARSNSSRTVAIGTRPSPTGVVVENDRSRTHERDKTMSSSGSVVPPQPLYEE